MSGKAVADAQQILGTMATVCYPRSVERARVLDAEGVVDPILHMTLIA